MAGRPPGHPKSGGRKAGTPNKRLGKRDAATLARAEELRRELEDHRPPPGVELSKEILGKFAHNLAAVAVKMWPQFKDTGEPVLRFEGHWERWMEMVRITRDFGSEAAGYQSPTFRAVMVTPPPDQVAGDNMRVINMRVFDAVGVAVADEDG